MSEVSFLEPNPDGRQHVILLGAGASRAAFPNGDAKGRRVPLMDDLVETLQLGALFEGAGVVCTTGDFEKLYSKLVNFGRHPEIASQIEWRVFEYFSSLELPPEPTLYDHLVLSLQPKDLIATFNWDPFLWQALNRNAWRAPCPQIAHLHGNVAVGYCTRHVPVSEGWRGRDCRRCGSPLTPSRLLFPINKQYSDELAISSGWTDLRRTLEQASVFTIFGYRAPSADLEAKRLLKSAWGIASARNLHQIEIIDIRPEAELRETWADFLYHYEVMTSFYQSTAAKFPRRSCEVWFGRNMNCAFEEPTQPITEKASWDEIQSLTGTLVKSEGKSKKRRKGQPQNIRIPDRPKLREERYDGQILAGRPLPLWGGKGDDRGCDAE